MMHTSSYPSAKVAIVGAGFVGSTAAYALMMNGAASEIALIDVNNDKAEGEALDLRHCMQFAHTVNIVAGDDFALVRDASVVVITAGIAQKPGQSRLDLVKTNVAVFNDIVPSIVRHNPDCTLLVVTNPLDVLTYQTLQLSGFPSCRVLGSGTVLDTARFRYQIGTHFEISPKDVVAYVLGEHGDSEFMWLSQANIAGIPLTQLPGYSLKLMQQLHQETRDAAYQIIAKKGATYYAIALVITKLVRAIILDQSRVFTVSTLIEDLYGVRDVCLSVPTVVRKNGVCQRLPLTLNDEEQQQFRRSAKLVRDAIDQALVGK
jgi:L-lactate dehydrogenase